MNRILIAWLLSACTASAVFGAEVPEPGERDARVRFVTYQKDEVTVVTVRRGAVTRIVLGDDEKIAVAASGFTADCQKAELEWCMRADVGTNQIWVKPKDHATHNNLELKTDKRDYSFEFTVLPDANGRGKKTARKKVPEGETMFRVIFRYPVQISPMSALLWANAANAPIRDKAVLDERLNVARPAARNWQYSMQIMPGADEIAPSLVFDDGRFTYFRFPANREVPTLYTLSPTGEESRTNTHMEGDLAVVQRISRRFVLRLGQAVVGVWNDAYDAEGVAPKDGTTIDGVIRTIR